MFNDTQAQNGVANYCAELISGNVVLRSSNSPPKAGYVANAAENGGYIAISVLFDVDSCDAGTAAADQQLNFASYGQDQCYQYLYTTLAEAYK